jgi:cytochrome P450 / NADPH-cytochrome P450 reductase
MEVSVNRELQNTSGPKPPERSTRHIEVKLPDGMTYRTGDHLSVVPSNGEALVERALKRFGFERDAHVRLSAGSGRKAFLPIDETISVQRLLAHHVELQQVATRKQIATMAEHTRCPMTKPKLVALAAGDEAGSGVYRAEVSKKRKSILDLLEEFPACELPFNVYLEMLQLMIPRYYSISSSPLADEGRCSITVAVVEGPARSGRGTYQGVCSTFLRRQASGSVIHAFIKETTAGFRLPDDARPIVMIGPGTGLAPFRGFLRERAALKAQGKPIGEAILFFGCRHKEQDYIYAEELESYAKAGLTQLFVACSRMGAKKIYVQDLIREHWREVWKLLDAGAKIYVCGDGSKMEPDVRRALGEMYRMQTRTDEAGAERWLADLTAQQRYVLDVWAGN